MPESVRVKLIRGLDTAPLGPMTSGPRGNNSLRRHHPVFIRGCAGTRMKNSFHPRPGRTYLRARRGVLSWLINARKSYVLYRECAGEVEFGHERKAALPAHSRYNTYDFAPAISSTPHTGFT